MIHLGYTQTLETKVIRRKHKVVFRVGMKVADFIKVLENVPSDAVVDEVIDDVNEDGGVASIEFHEEKVEAPTK